MESPPVHVERIRPEDPRWEAVVAFLDETDHARWVLDESRRLRRDHHVLAALEDDVVAGCLVLHEREIVIPATAWSGGKEAILRDAGGRPVRETFVQTFFVHPAMRRRGVGRALQTAALALTGRLGCLQMRSWSSLDKLANQALKLGMGFALHPATQVTPSGLEVSGMYFVARVPPAGPR